MRWILAHILEFHMEKLRVRMPTFAGTGMASQHLVSVWINDDIFLKNFEHFTLDRMTVYIDVLLRS